jgi:Rap1a immunity proteins
MIKLATAAVLAISFSTSAANAVVVEGKELYETCKAPDINVGPCMAYVLGVADTLESARAAGQGVPKICIPPQTTRAQLVSPVKVYLDRNPQDLNLGAAILVTKALAEAFPCP